MDKTVMLVGGGYLLGIVLFFVCERMGWLYKWSGLKKPGSKPDQSNREVKQ